MINTPKFGHADATYQAMGGEEGIVRLVSRFYSIMQSNPDFQRIWLMHERPVEESVDRLACFLCGWAGGPKRYQEKYGSLSIPRVHLHLDIGPIERDQWLACMSQAMAAEELGADLVEYLLRQLNHPAQLVTRKHAS